MLQRKSLFQIKGSMLHMGGSSLGATQKKRAGLIQQLPHYYHMFLLIEDDNVTGKSC